MSIEQRIWSRVAKTTMNANWHGSREVQSCAKVDYLIIDIDSTGNGFVISSISDQNYERCKIDGILIVIRGWSARETEITEFRGITISRYHHVGNDCFGQWLIVCSRNISFIFYQTSSNYIWAGKATQNLYFTEYALQESGT